MMLTISRGNDGRSCYEVVPEDIIRRLRFHHTPAELAAASKLLPKRPRAPGVLHAATWAEQNAEELEDIVSYLEGAVRLGLEEASGPGAAAVLDGAAFSTSLLRLMYSRATSRFRCRRHLTGLSVEERG